MAIKTIYLGSEGPFKYDDTELVNDPDGLFAGILQNTIVTDGNLFGVVVGGAKFDDLNASNILEIVWNEDDTIDRTLNLLVNAANRSINLSGDLVVSAGAGTLDQSVASGAGPTFSPALHTQGTDTTLGDMIGPVNLVAGTNSPEMNPVKFKEATLRSAPEPGALEFDGTDLYITVAL